LYCAHEADGAPATIRRGVYRKKESAITEVIESLPILPLESVLFPRVAVRLHVLEPAYQAMVERCQHDEVPFGIALIRRASKVGKSAPRVHDIGCTARVKSLECMAGGRQKLMGMGGERFHIRSLNTSHGLIRAEVELMHFEPMSADELQAFGARLRPWVRQYFKILVQGGQGRRAELMLPKDPIKLGFLAATVIDIPAREKQHLLGTIDTHLFFRALILAYQREVGLLQTLLARGLDHVLKSFPLN
jgi:Lon protease-like protein